MLELELNWYHGRLRFWYPDTGDYLPDFPGLEDRWLVIAEQREAAIIDRDVARSEGDAFAAAYQAEVAARQDAETRIRQLEAQLAYQQ